MARNAKNDIDGAIADFTAAIRLNPSDESVYKQRALLFAIKKADADDQIAAYTEDIKNNPGQPFVYELRAKAYVDRAKRIYQFAATNKAKYPGDQPDWNKAAADYTAAFEIRIKSEADPRAWLEKKGRFDSPEYNPAIGAACWGEITKLYPKDTTAWDRLAGIDITMEDLQKSLADYTEVIRLDPKNAEAYRQRATVHGKGPDARKEQVADLTESLRLQPDKVTYLNLAMIYENMQDYDKAAADYGEAIRLGLVYLGYKQRAAMYTGMREWDKAIADYTELLKTFEDSEIYHNRAELYYREKDWDHVIADMDKAMQMDTEEANAFVKNEAENGGTGDKVAGDGVSGSSLVMRGDAWARKGMYDKALADFRRVSAGNANDWEAISAEAWVLATCPDAKLRDGAKALELAKKPAPSTRSGNAESMDTLAAAEAETGQWNEAVDYETKAIAKMKEDKQFWVDNTAHWLPSFTHTCADEDEKRIQDYTARLELYKKHQPCREMKQMEWSLAGGWGLESDK